MEDNSLNFDRPFLSVRRRTPTLPSEQRDDKRKTNFSRPAIPRLPPNRSELKSGPIRNPGSVPFLWEQTPGQPKKEAKPNALNHDRPPLVPRLPPGRYPKANQKDSDKLPPSISAAKNQDAIVPATSDNRMETSNASNENVEKGESSKEARKEEESSDSGDSDAFVDALDTLSRTESAFLNCSVTDVNELDHLDVESSGIFLTDPQAQKFMMDRFLPAAKAMASDSLHYAPKRQPVVQEQPQPVSKGVNQCKPLLRYGPSFAKRYTEYCANEEEEEDSEDDGDRPEYMRTACGLLPRFCMKGSIGSLNPVPGMSVRTRTPISSYKTRNRSSSAGSYSETYNELRSDTAEMESVERIQPAEFVNRMAQPRNNSKQLGARTTATYCDAPYSFLETKEVPNGHEEQTNDDNDDPGLYGEGFKTFQEVLADRDTGKELDSGSSVVEKTLYVDTIQKLETETLTLPSQDHDITTKKVDCIHKTDSTADNFKEFEDVAGGEKLVPSAKKYDESNISLSLDTSNGTHTMEVPNDSTTSTRTTDPVKETADNLEKQSQSYSDLLAPPPLPKSPSDSWLLRTLPGISKNSSLHSHLGAAKSPQNHSANASTNDVKWETIVKSTKSQHHHMNHSLGLLTTIPEA